MKIHAIYINGEKAFLSANYNSCKEAVADVYANNGNACAGVYLKAGDKVTAKVYRM